MSQFYPVQLRLLPFCTTQWRLNISNSSRWRLVRHRVSSREVYHALNIFRHSMLSENTHSEKQNTQLKKMCATWLISNIINTSFKYGPTVLERYTKRSRRGGEKWRVTRKKARLKEGIWWLTVHLIDCSEGGHVNAVNVINREGRQEEEEKGWSGEGWGLTFAWKITTNLVSHFDAIFWYPEI